MVLILGTAAFVLQRNAIPDRVHACGRDYGHTDGTEGAGPFTLAQLKRREGSDLSKRTTAGKYEVWTHPECGLGVFLRTGTDRFLGYGLIGGP